MGLFHQLFFSNKKGVQFQQGMFGSSTHGEEEGKVTDVSHKGQMPKEMVSVWDVDEEQEEWAQLDA